MKSYKIAAVSLSTTMVACADPIIGDWDGKTITQEDTRMDLPYELCSEYEGEETDCYTIDLFMSFDEDKIGVLDLTTSGMELEGNMLPLESSQGYKYAVSILGNEINLSCEITNGILECDFDGAFTAELEKVQ